MVNTLLNKKFTLQKNIVETGLTIVRAAVNLESHWTELNAYINGAFTNDTFNQLCN